MLVPICRGRNLRPLIDWSQRLREDTIAYHAPGSSHRNGISIKRLGEFFPTMTSPEVSRNAGMA